ncbi:MAG: DinB family protein [Bdellovibrionota bacterium]|nr:DinB family protein [Bdellovibrionota bacterium]
MSRKNKLKAGIERFLGMTNIKRSRIRKFLENIKNEIYKVVPIDSSKNSSGNCVGEIKIDTLSRHIVIAEKAWLTPIFDFKDIGTIPITQSVVIEADLIPDKAVDYYDSQVDAFYEKLRDIDHEILFYEINFVGKKYTVMGYLWLMFSHNAFHLGQVDLLMRQQELLATEFMGGFDLKGAVV